MPSTPSTPRPSAPAGNGGADGLPPGLPPNIPVPPDVAPPPGQPLLTDPSIGSLPPIDFGSATPTTHITMTSPTSSNPTPNASNRPDPNTSSHSSKKPLAAIIAGSISGVVILAVVAWVIFLILRRRRQKLEKRKTAVAPIPSPTGGVSTSEKSIPVGQAQTTGPVAPSSQLPPRSTIVSFAPPPTIAVAPVSQAGTDVMADDPFATPPDNPTTRAVPVSTPSAIIFDTISESGVPHSGAQNVSELAAGDGEAEGEELNFDEGWANPEHNMPVNKP